MLERPRRENLAVSPPGEDTTNLETTGPYTRTFDRSGASRIRGKTHDASPGPASLRFRKHGMNARDFEAALHSRPVDSVPVSPVARVRLQSFARASMPGVFLAEGIKATR